MIRPDAMRFSLDKPCSFVLFMFAWCATYTPYDPVWILAGGTPSIAADGRSVPGAPVRRNVREHSGAHRQDLRRSGASMVRRAALHGGPPAAHQFGMPAGGRRLDEARIHAGRSGPWQRT